MEGDTQSLSSLNRLKVFSFIDLEAMSNKAIEHRYGPVSNLDLEVVVCRRISIDIIQERATTA